MKNNVLSSELFLKTTFTLPHSNSTSILEYLSRYVNHSLLFFITSLYVKYMSSIDKGTQSDRICPVLILA